MFFIEEMPNPTVDSIREMRAINRDIEATRHISGIMMELRKIFMAVTPEAIIAIASMRYPDDEPEDALHKVESELLATNELLAFFDNAFKEKRLAEKERLGGVLKKAIKRHFQIADAISQLDRRGSKRALEIEVKRKKLRDAGLSEDEVEKHVEQVDPAVDAEERTSLLSEFNQIDFFIKTLDESILPESFVRDFLDEEDRQRLAA